MSEDGRDWLEIDDSVPSDGDSTTLSYPVDPGDPEPDPAQTPTLLFRATEN